MTDIEKKEITLQEAAETLLNFSIDRNDLNIILNTLPEDATIDNAKVEYEIQILKILSVGWSLPFYMENSALEKGLTEAYWLSVREFSQQLSKASSITLDNPVDYFAVIKERLNVYVDALNNLPNATDPAAVIGPKFSEMCGNSTNAFITLTGSKMFSLAVRGARHYLDAIYLKP